MEKSDETGSEKPKLPAGVCASFWPLRQKARLHGKAQEFPAPAFLRDICAFHTKAGNRTGKTMNF